jgi:NitT/TauT family transport system ATP-binding protein
MTYSTPMPTSGNSSDHTDKQELGSIEIDKVSIIFGQGENAFFAVDRVSARIESGEFVCILGPSGCGKSTLLNAIAGFEIPSEGVVRIDGNDIDGPGADRSMVFQTASLFPWKSVRGNVAFGPRMLGTSDREAFEIADELLETVGLAGFADAKPQTLSGGMQQRVAIARALANRPNILLMDEPFGALDAQTRLMMQENLLKIWNDFNTTIVFVTHDIDEAIFLSDRILVMSASPGRIVQELDVSLGRPRDTNIVVDPSYAEFKKSCMDVIRTESLRAFEQQMDRVK